MVGRAQPMLGFLKWNGFKSEDEYSRLNFTGFIVIDNKRGVTRND